MKISLILPIYKVEAYIQECLESIMCQICDGFRIECVLIDDCSPDSSMDIAKRTISENTNEAIDFVLLHHNVNRGISAVRNTGIKASTGDYLFFMDSDDKIFENTFQTLIRGITDKANVDMVIGNSYRMHDDVLANSLFIRDGIGSVLLDDKHDLWIVLLRGILDLHVWNRLVKRSFVLEHNLFFDEGIIFEDFPWMYRFIQCAQSVLILHDVTYIYFDNPDSQVNTLPQRANLFVKSLSYSCFNILNTPPRLENGRSKIIEVSHLLYLQHWMLIASDFVERFSVDDESKESIKCVKKGMFKRAVKLRHGFTAFFILFLFNPLKCLLKFKLFRNNIQRIDSAVYRLSELLYG